MLPIVDDVGGAGNTGYGSFSVASNGTLAYSRREETVELVWLDRSGERLEVASAAANVRSFSLSPDERKLAIFKIDQRGSADLWVQDLPGGTPSRFTFGPSPGWASAVWSPDGSEIVFASTTMFGQAEYEIRRKRTDMSGGEQVVMRSDGTLVLFDWSPDGKQLLLDAGVGFDLWMMPLEDDGTPTAYLERPGSQALGQFSPEGRWIAYVSDEHGADQVYAQPYPATGALWQVSTDGGSMPRWRGDGRELFYRADDGRLMAVAVNRGATDSFEHGTPEPLFESVPPVPGNIDAFTYQPSRDGQRFLVALAAADARPIAVVVNWQAAVGSP